MDEERTLVEEKYCDLKTKVINDKLDEHKVILDHQTQMLDGIQQAVNPKIQANAAEIVIIKRDMKQIVGTKKRKTDIFFKVIMGLCALAVLILGMANYYK